MSKRQHTLLMGYAKRMGEIAKLAAEMKDIADKYEREFGVRIADGDLSRVLTGERLAKLHAELAADRPAQPEGFAQDVLTGMGDTAQPGTAPAPGSALGLAEAPKPLVDLASTEPVKWGQVDRTMERPGRRTDV